MFGFLYPQGQGKALFAHLKITGCGFTGMKGLEEKFSFSQRANTRNVSFVIVIR